MLRLCLAMMVIWFMLSGEFSLANVVLAFCVGLTAIWFTQRGTTQVMEVPGLSTTLRRSVAFGKLLIFFLYELLLSNLRLIAVVLRPKLNLRPGIVAVPIQNATPPEMLILANMLTLTPGTLSLDIANDQNTLFVHSMHVDDPAQFREMVQNDFHRRLREVFR